MRFTATLVGDRELIAKLESMPNRVHEELLKACDSLTVRITEYIRHDKLEGQVLKHKSGKLWQSIQGVTEDRGTAVYGMVFSAGDIKYPALHEYGQEVREHTRRVTAVFGERPKFPVWANVRAFKMPERSFMRSALADKQDEITDGLTAAVNRGVS